MKTFPGGVHPHDFKHFSKQAGIETPPLPGKVAIPLSQHIGAPAKPVVKKGDEVLAGQLIAEAGGFVSIPMHASISGKVTRIGPFAHPGGAILPAIEITGDGEDNWVDLPEDPDWQSLDAAEIKKRIAAAGVCGMGGAGFPTHVKLSPPADKPIDTVILNGVECEPYLTSDYRVMLERSEDILAGLRLIMKALDAKRGYIGIEANKPDAIKQMRTLVKSEPNIKVVGLKLKYPQGAEKQLIYACTKRKVPNKGGLPMAVGVVVQNVGTAVAVYEAVRWRKPLVQRVITVTGSVVKTPKNFNARVGTLYSHLLEHAGGATADIGKVISGGPMMGFAISTLDTPMAKTSSGIVIMGIKEAQKDTEYTCLRCGRCVDICPLNLVPSMIARNVRYEDWDAADKAGCMDCMKCGGCAYVCPSHIKLIQWIDIGKNKIGQLRREAADKTKEKQG
ncbi:MAG: electron transport complex subunit RsxC [Candidatus Cloacimonetes bacterium]|nr:electron transport complex subunit RsxC [Candidatus Cloacimonadota bacterium]